MLKAESEEEDRVLSVSVTVEILLCASSARTSPHLRVSSLPALHLFILSPCPGGYEPRFCSNCRIFPVVLKELMY